MTHEKISKFSILIGWTLSSTGMWRREIFATSDLDVIVVDVIASVFTDMYTFRIYLIHLLNRLCLTYIRMWEIDTEST